LLRSAALLHQPPEDSLDCHRSRSARQRLQLFQCVRRNSRWLLSP
jgi:hypothetical protein